MYPAPRYRGVPGDARDPGILRSRAASRFPPERCRPDGGSRFFPIDREIARRIRSAPLSENVGVPRDDVVPREVAALARRRVASVP